MGCPENQEINSLPEKKICSELGGGHSEKGLDPGVSVQGLMREDKGGSEKIFQKKFFL